MELFGIFTMSVLALTMIMFLMFWKQLSSIFSNYRNMVIVSVILLMYMAVFRFGTLVADWRASNWTYNEEKYESLFLTNMCPFLSVFLPLMNIFKSKKLASSISSWGIMGPLIVLGSLATAKSNNQNLASFIFLVYENGMGYWMLHYMLLIVSLLTLVSTSKISFKNIWINMSFMFFYLLYLEIISSTTGLTINLTGMGPGDWSKNKENPRLNGVFYTVGTMLKTSPIMSMAMGLTFFTIMNLIILSSWGMWIKRFVLTDDNRSMSFKQKNDLNKKA